MKKQLILIGFLINIISSLSLPIIFQSNSINSRFDITSEIQKKNGSDYVIYDEPSYNENVNNDYFIIKYNSSYNSKESALEYLNVFEDARVKILNDGYKQNYANEIGEKTEVRLDPFAYDSDNSFSAVTRNKDNVIYNKNKTKDYITIYNSTNFKQSLKESIYHEFFHTILDNYNAFYKTGETKWFIEAIANWAKYKYCDNAYLVNSRILEYMSYDYKRSLFSTDGYNEFLFAFTLEKMFDNNIIKKIFEYMNDLTINQTFTSLKKIINNVIKVEYSSTYTFDTIFKNMCAYLISTNENFSNYNIFYDDEVFEKYNNTSILIPISSTSLSINSFASSFYKIELPSNVNYHDISLELKTTISDLYPQIYIIDNNNNHYVFPFNKQNNKYSYNISGLSSYINKAYIIISNCNLNTISTNLEINYTNHNYNNHYCTFCNQYLEDHLYTSNYSSLNKTSHYAYCSCGEYKIMPHTIETGSTNNKKTCIYCGATNIIAIEKN